MPGPAFKSGERVALRTVEAEDEAFIRRHRNDPRLRKPLDEVELKTTSRADFTELLASG